MASDPIRYRGGSRLPPGAVAEGRGSETVDEEPVVTGSGDGAIFVLDPGPEILAQAQIYGELATPADRLRALARAIAASPGFAGLHDAVLVVRTQPPLKLALLGRFSPAERDRVESLPGILENGLRRLRYVSYEEAQRVTLKLAERLEEEIGRAELAECRFVGLPRGGLLVLGMLAYVLGLRADQMDPLGSMGLAGPRESEGTLVLVDDCALSGLRFVETLRRTTAPQVVFAHLFSHPSLRAAIARREPRVRACLAGEDLTDMTETLLGAESDAWRDRWRVRSREGVCWIGLPEHVCFPWNEPDITVWNRTQEAEEAPWRVVPPELCLKNRPLAGEVRKERLQEQGPAPGPLQPGDSTIIARLHGDEGGILAADWETGKAYRFGGVAAGAWDALLAEGSLDGAVDVLKGEYDAPEQQLRADALSVLERALELGLMKRNGRDEA